jgi:ketosteroid isomerase-like protein
MHTLYIEVGRVMPLDRAWTRIDPSRYIMATDTEKRNMELMQTLDDAWNRQDGETFEQCHMTDTVVRRPAQPPTQGVGAHRAECVQFFQTFPDNHIDNGPYKTFFTSGGLLHGRALARWADRRGEPLLRSGRHDAAAWNQGLTHHERERWREAT